MKFYLPLTRISQGKVYDALVRIAFNDLILGV